MLLVCQDIVAIRIAAHCCGGLLGDGVCESAVLCIFRVGRFEAAVGLTVKERYLSCAVKCSVGLTGTVRTHSFLSC